MNPTQKTKYHNPLDTENGALHRNVPKGMAGCAPNLEVLVLPDGGDGGSHPALTVAADTLGLDTAKPVACRSILQAVQLQELMEQELFPDCDIEIVPGNLTEALNRLDGKKPDGEGRYGGLVCNGFDLAQLGQAHRIRAIFPVEEMIPTGGQGCKNEVEQRAEAAFSAEIRRLCTAGDGFQSDACAAGDSFQRDDPLNDSLLTAVYAEGDEEEVELWAVCYDPFTGEWWTDWIAGKADEAELLAEEFARQTVNAAREAAEDSEEDEEETSVREE